MGQHSWGLAEAKVSAPPEKARREILDHLLFPRVRRVMSRICPRRKCAGLGALNIGLSASRKLSYKQVGKEIDDGEFRA